MVLTEMDYNPLNLSHDDYFRLRDDVYMKAAMEGNLDVLIECINHGITIIAFTPDGRTALHCACKYRHINIVRYLIKECHIDVTKSDCAGKYTPFHLATKYDSIDIVQYMIQECSDCDFELQVDGEGMNALCIACMYGCYTIVKYLIGECHWSLHTRTALYYACKYSHVDIFHYMIHESNCCDITSEIIQNLLRVAVRHSRHRGLAMTQYLIDTCHADITATFNDNQNIFDLLLEYRSRYHTDIVVLLLNNLLQNKKI